MFRPPAAHRLDVYKRQVQDVCNGVPLMLAKLNFRGHAAEGDVPPVVLTGTGGVEKLIVCLLYTSRCV